MLRLCVAKNHAESKEEQDNSACNLKGPQSEAQRLKQKLTRHQKGHQHESGYQNNAYGKLAVQLFGTFAVA
ncbi:hypothetical protein Z949_3796 [Sulfitobacter guttiformis KCTC 32187]|nr:hypothetical protein Z949_3796 [Sulfitobacter guttiformis KCTC 32187]